MDEDDITTDPVFLGLTRPATLLGVPMIPLVAAMLPVVVVFIGTANPLVLAAAVPVWGVLYLMARTDPYRLSGIDHWRLTRALYSRSATYWGAPSVSPRPVRRFHL